MVTTVVNLRRSGYDVYIGRAGKGLDGYFGNPFRLSPGDDRAAVLDRYRGWFLERIRADGEFRRKVLALRGKRLGCFCKPLACHGDVLAAWVDAQEPASCVEKDNAARQGSLFSP
jgi:hypothetical protein